MSHAFHVIDKKQIDKRFDAITYRDGFDGALCDEEHRVCEQEKRYDGQISETLHRLGPMKRERKF